MTVVRTACLALIAASIAAAQFDSLKQHFQRPPDDARIMMRWWWFGPAVTRPELEREMRAMKEAGIGGVEIQPVYPLELDHNLPFLSPEFLDALQFTSVKARELGLRVDLTLGSGWPYGGPQIPVTLAAGRLRYERVPIPPGAREVKPPPEKEGEKRIAAFLEDNGSTRELAMDGTVPPSSEPRAALFFFSSRTGMLVKRAAAGAEGYVLDHYDRAALDHYLQAVGEPLLNAFGPNPPYAIFCDSLEVYGSDWTTDLLEEFQKRRGYDLKPHLPALVGDAGPDNAAIRDDWGLTLTELAEERFLAPLNQWATRHGTRLRAQAYGTPPVALSSNRLVDLPEGEGSFWNRFTATRWATSAAHLFGRPVVSAETWTWLHSPAFRATPLDMKAEADQMFLQGVNQIVGHGWPYSPDGAGEPGWRFYAAGALNEHNPWWIVMPDLTAYLQRVSYLLRQGRQVTDVALYLPSADARASFAPGRVALSETLQEMINRTGVIPQILHAGFNFDFVDDNIVQDSIVGRYPVIVLPDVERMPPKTHQALDAFVHAGGSLIATGHAALAASLLKVKKADAALSPPAPAIGFVHRTTGAAEIYFLANTGNTAAHTQATFRVRGLEPEWWDAFTGATTPAPFQVQADGAIAVALDLEPYESRLLVFVGQAS
ncbi:MAG TPA: glycosyl hydrolase, partial [Bryobacteraceae bacterium]|nr:glycosyl hydrolase [Bryobacteraceae bacterium]